MATLSFSITNINQKLFKLIHIFNFYSAIGCLVCLALIGVAGENVYGWADGVLVIDSFDSSL